jgi:type VI secretion system protein ImpE
MQTTLDMPTTGNIQQLLRCAQLDDAITVLNAEIRSNPTSVDRRALLAELLCIGGNLERADIILNSIDDVNTGITTGVTQFRQLVRAEQARQQFYAEGRIPEFLAKPDAVLELELRAAIAVREGELDDAVTLLTAREAARLPVAGVADGIAFDDFRDLDDLSAAHLEVLTATGKYFWIPVSSVTEILFREPASRRDLFWRQAHLCIADGSEAEVFIPAIYTAKDNSAAHRLGHLTEFDGERATFGKGLRSFLLGDTSRTILELRRITFTPQPLHA